MSYLFNLLLAQPLLNVLVFFYNTIAFENLGVAIILLTVFIRLLLFPLFHKSMRHQKVLQGLQPKIKEIQKSHAADKVKQTEAMMALYREEGVNPFSGIGFLLVQIPILIALYHLFLRGLSTDAFTKLYPFIDRPETLNTTFLGLINLNEPYILLVVLAAIAQYFQGRLAMPPKQSGPENAMERMSRQMLFLGPILTLVIFAKLPAAVGLYWVVTSVASIVQQAIVNKDIHDRSQLGTIHKGAGGKDGVSRRQS